MIDPSNVGVQKSQLAACPKMVPSTVAFYHEGPVAKDCFSFLQETWHGSAMWGALVNNTTGSVTFRAQK